MRLFGSEGAGEVHAEIDPNVVYGRFGPAALGETASGASAAAYLNADQRGGTSSTGKPSLTIDEAAVQLTRHQVSWGDYWGDSATVTFAFRATAPADMPDDTSGFSRFSATQINATLLALQAWSDVANITFNRVDSGGGTDGYSNSATILFGNYSSGSDGAAAFAYYPYSYAHSAVDGDVWINSSLSYNANPQPFNYGQLVLIHEIGHAIGISHPADYNAGDDENITYSQHATYFEDSMQYTVMSYFYETYTGASYGSPYPATIMLDDIAAAQRLYGANMSTRTGDTVYGFNSNSGRSWFTANSASTPLIFAVWDAGGNDTFDFSGYSSNARIELREGFFSNVGGLTGNIAVAKGAVIENAKGGHGADTIIGNAAANRLQGNAGADTLTGLGGADVFVFTAGGGADIVTDFVVGTDKLDASAFGSYISIVQSGADTVVNFTSTVSARLTNTTASNLTDASFIGLNSPEPPPPPPPPPPTSGVTVNGTAGADLLNGGAGDDFLYGFGGADRLDGGAGADTMLGGAGNDIYLVENTGDVVSEAANEGFERVLSSVSFTLSDHVEALTLSGSAAVNGVGNDQNNIIYGNGAANILTGGRGNDQLNGGAGADVFVFTAGGGADFITDFVIGTDKLDASAFGSYISIVQSGADAVVNFTSNVSVRLTNTAASNLTAASFVGLNTSQPSSGATVNGTSGADLLNGGAGDDFLYGFGGADRLDGGVGADTMLGGAGNDLYVVENAGDAVSEAANEGFERVLSSASFTLSDHVEALTLTGSAAINGAGNDQNNIIYGNGGANVLTGGGGNDQLNGGAGADVFVFTAGGGADFITDFVIGTDKLDASAFGSYISIVQSGADAVVNFTSTVSVRLTNTTASNLTAASFVGLNSPQPPSGATVNGTAGADLLNGGSGDDFLYGFGGADRLDGGAGADTMLGGAGNDLYVVENAGDVVSEAANEGFERVLSSVSFTLSDHVEALTLTGSAAVNGAGNDQDNIIYGNGAANILTGGGGNDQLNGGAGADTLRGGLGDDVYTVDSAGDVIVENPAEGTDYVYSSVSFTLSANVEGLFLTGSAAIDATGDALDNRLYGNDAANTLIGGEGADLLTGRAGADVFVYQGLADSTLERSDRIGDFDPLVDRIDLSAIDANAAVAGNQAFAWAGALTGQSGQAVLTYDAARNLTTLSLDANGDALADFRLIIDGQVTGDSGFIL